MLKQMFKGSTPLTVTGLLMLIALPPSLIGLAVDPRLITGAPAWLKPIKFTTSIALYAFTLAWILSLLPQWPRMRRIVGWSSAVALILELVIIDTQAIRGTTSHFNVSTPLDAAMWIVMGVTIVAQTLVSIAVAVALFREPFSDRALGWALRLGMTITIVGAFTGGLMSRPTSAQIAAARGGQRMAISGAHTVGAPDGGSGLPGTGWSLEHGDVRVAHFMGLHALQALPLIAVGLRRRRIGDNVRIRLTLTAAGSYVTLFAILLWQALRGQSVVAPDAVTAAALIAWVAITSYAVRRSFSRRGSLGTSTVEAR